MKQLPLNDDLLNNDLTVPAFGYELIREVLLADLLGKEASDLLYWAGKRLARTYRLTSTDEIISFFKHAGWGDLTIKKQTSSTVEFELKGELLAKRFKTLPACHFQLEAGFLAEQIQLQNGFLTEAFEQTKKRTARVIFTVKSDLKEPIEE